MYIAKGEVPCLVNDPKYWFSEREDSKTTRIGKALCRMCPERADCLRSTIRYERREGEVQPCILGGLTQSERRAMYEHPAGSKTETA